MTSLSLDWSMGEIPVTFNGRTMMRILILWSKEYTTLPYSGQIALSVFTGDVVIC